MLYTTKIEQTKPLDMNTWRYNEKSIGAKTLLFPTPVLMVGAYDQADKPNLMTAAWGGICCSQPPCVAVSLRKATYSYNCSVERKAFTVGKELK